SVPIYAWGFSTFALGFNTTTAAGPGAAHATALMCDPFTSLTIIGLTDAETAGMVLGDNTAPKNFGAGAGGLSSANSKAVGWGTFAIAIVNDEAVLDMQVTAINLFGAARILAG